MSSTTNAVFLKTIQSMKEIPFTNQILRPLFSQLGYERVDFHHGVGELGRDLILTKQRPLIGTEITVVQVKMFAFTISSRKKNSFADLISQLEVASETPVLLPEGIKRIPHYVFFVTPFIIPTRVLESRPEFVRISEKTRFQIIDGSLIARLIEKELPRIFSEIVGPVELAKKATNRYDGRKPLMVSIRSNRNMDFSEYYCDLEFTPGRDESHFFFDLSGNLPASPISPAISETEWDKLEQLISQISKPLGIKCPFVFDLLKARDYREKYLKDLEAKTLSGCKLQLRRALNGEMNTALTELTLHNLKSLFSSLDSIKGLNEEVKKLLATADNYVANGLSKISISESNTWFDQLSLSSTAMQERWAQPVVRAKITKEINTMFSIVRDGIDKMREMHQMAIEQFTNKRTVKYKVGIDRYLLFKGLLSKREWIVREIEKINCGSLGSNELSGFLSSAKDLFDVLDQIQKVDGLLESVLSDYQLPVERPPRPKIQVPLSVLFSTGTNFAVFGEAGAGKTTSLQNYVENQELVKDARLNVFIPLSEFTKIKIKPRNSLGISAKEEFLNYVDQFFEENGYFNNLEMLRKEAKLTLILDGIDEAAKPFPWLIQGIRDFAEASKDVQVITSSRLTAENLDLLPFLGVTIRPFTILQQRQFIRAVLNDEEISKVVLEHLDQNEQICNVTRNPLLATVLCEIAKNSSRNLPRHESRLYEERLDLLISLYDPAKGISRIESDRIFVREVAQRIAFFLHQGQVRSACMDDIVSILVRDFQHRFSLELISKAVKELRNPCNILVEMNYKGDLGFGHLRFQEHLVSEELGKFPDTVVKYISSSWWTGAIYLWAQNARDVMWLFRRLAEDDNLKSSGKTIELILSQRSQLEINEIDSITDEQDRRKDLKAELEIDQAQRENSGLV